METIRYRPVRNDGITHGYLSEYICKKLYRAGKIDDTWDIEVHIPDEDTLIEKPSTLWTK